MTFSVGDRVCMQVGDGWEIVHGIVTRVCNAFVGVLWDTGETSREYAWLLHPEEPPEA